MELDKIVWNFDLSLKIFIQPLNRIKTLGELTDTFLETKILAHSCQNFEDISNQDDREAPRHFQPEPFQQYTFQNYSKKVHKKF